MFTLLPEEKKQEPLTLKGSAGSYGAGVVGGAGGVIPDVLSLAEPLTQFSQNAKDIMGAVKGLGLKGTEQLTQDVASEFGLQEPQNALERILKQSGQFGGQEALIGTGLGGPVGAGLGLAHGTASGALYGALKELGLDDHWALGVTTLATVSPIAAEKLITKYKAGKPFADAIKATQKEFPASLPQEAAEAAQEAAHGAIKPGTILPEAKDVFGKKKAVIGKINEPAVQKPLGIQVAIEQPEVRPLTGRVSEAPELGNVISKEAFETEASAGRELSREINEIRDAEREIVREKYANADEITRTHNDVYPELSYKNEIRIAKLEELEKRGAGEESVYQDALSLRNMIGTPDALREVNAARLMKQANSFSQKVKYELPYAGYKGEIKSIVHDMNQSVIESIRRAGKNPDVVIEADKTFGRFADRFMNDKIASFFKRKNLIPEELIRKTLSDEGTYRAIKQAIGSRKNPLINKVDREIVHGAMDKYYKNPSEVGSKEYNKDLKNLSQSIGKEKVADVDLFLREKQLSHEKKARMAHKIKESSAPINESALRKLKEKVKVEPIVKTPEELDKVFSKVSDIRRFKKQMKQMGLEKELQETIDDKIVSIFKEGKFGEQKLTGKDLTRVIDKNHEILTELMGSESISDLYKIGKIAENSEITQELIINTAKKIGKELLKMAGLGKFIKLLPKF